MIKKQRLDLLLVERNLFESRERARRIIMAGEVLVNDQKIDKAGTLVSTDCTIRLLGADIPFVSRGGLKLSKALETFSIELEGKIAADIGASTGGFTDCMLQRGAKKVFAIDVGYGQLDWKLRNDPRVVNMERTNIRHVTRDMLGEPIEFASIDVAFISLEKVLPTVFDLIDQGEVVALIKPQFEAGRSLVGKHGVVRDQKVHVDVIEKVIDSARSLGFAIGGLTFSPIKGPEGNIEYLVRLIKIRNAVEASVEIPIEIPIEIEKIVGEAHHSLKG